MVICANLNKEIRRYLETLQRDILLSIWLKVFLAIKINNLPLPWKLAMICVIFNSYSKVLLINLINKINNFMNFQSLFETESLTLSLKVDLKRICGWKGLMQLEFICLLKRYIKALQVQILHLKYRKSKKISSKKN